MSAPPLWAPFARCQIAAPSYSGVAIKSCQHALPSQVAHRMLGDVLIDLRCVVIAGGLRVAFLATTAQQQHEALATTAHL